MKKIFLTGSTGLLGKMFLEEASNEEFEIVLGKRTLYNSVQLLEQQYYDLEDSALDLNLDGIDIVVHLASNTKDLSANSDIIGIQKLLKFINQYKVKHLVFISIVGVDKMPVKYFKTKHKVEKLIQENCKAYTILRSTQFLEFFEEEVKKQLKRGFSIVPNIKYQPIETLLVAKKLIQICKRDSTNSISEIGGSEPVFFYDAIRAYQKWKGIRSIIISIPNILLGKLGKSLTTESRMINSKTWDQYLDQKKTSF